MSQASGSLQAQGPEPVAVRSPAGVLNALCAWCLLVLTDVALMAGGFSCFYAMVKAWPTIGAAPPDRVQDSVSRVTGAVNIARTCYFKRAWCLQRAAAAVCYLRLCGVNAQLVIAVQKFPFHAHAWAEV